MTPLDLRHPVWEQVFMVAPLTVIGTKEPDGTYDLAPKHMAMPLSWEDHYGFVCTPAHATYANAKREGAFTVSFPSPDQVLLTSLAAAPRHADDRKHALSAVPTHPASKVDGVLLENALIHLECELDRIVDGLGENSLVVGRIVAASGSEGCLVDADADPQDRIGESPLLAYVHPGRFAKVRRTQSFPYHQGYRR